MLFDHLHASKQTLDYRLRYGFLNLPVISNVRSYFSGTYACVTCSELCPTYCFFFIILFWKNSIFFSASILVFLYTSTHSYALLVLEWHKYSSLPFNDTGPFCIDFSGMTVSCIVNNTNNYQGPCDMFCHCFFPPCSLLIPDIDGVVKWMEYPYMSDKVGSTEHFFHCTYLLIRVGASNVKA